jgi:hypothetical protein
VVRVNGCASEPNTPRALRRLDVGVSPSADGTPQRDGTTGVGAHIALNESRGQQKHRTGDAAHWLANGSRSRPVNLVDHPPGGRCVRASDCARAFLAGQKRHAVCGPDDAERYGIAIRDVLDHDYQHDDGERDHRRKRE